MAEPNIEEAERRIAEARINGSESLDLSRLALQELPESLRNLPRLRQLDLSASKSLFKASDEDPSVPAKRGVVKTVLKILFSGAKSRFNDLSTLSDLKQLEKLRLTNVEVSNVSHLSDLKNLRELDLSGTQVTDISALSGLKKLENFNLSGTGVEDLSPLSGLIHVDALNLSHTKVANVAALSSLNGLVSLDLSYAVAINLSSLTSLKNLRKLNIYHCRPVISLLVLRAFLERFCLEELVADEVVGIPREILSGSCNDNCLSRLRIYLSELALMATEENGQGIDGSTRDSGKSLTVGRESAVDVGSKLLTGNEQSQEVFVSYAWGDGSPEGKIRAEVVDRLCLALAEDGFVPVRDRDRIKPGDLISDFIAKLTRADRVVTVVSDKFLRSPYCMYEVYKIWQKWQGDADEMIRRVVPIILPDVRVGYFEERAPYLEYWFERAEKLEALIRKPNLRPGRESWEEVRLVREFAHHVDDILVFINDVLMPRDLEVHFEGDFEAVREALRRRLRPEGAKFE